MMDFSHASSQKVSSCQSGCLIWAHSKHKKRRWKRERILAEQAEGLVLTRADLRYSRLVRSLLACWSWSPESRSGLSGFSR